MSFRGFVRKNHLGMVSKEASFKDITTMRLGGRIKYIYFPNDINSLVRAMKYISKKRLKFFVIGHGSNIIASDKVFNGVVISLKRIPPEVSIKDNEVTVGGGVSLNHLVETLAESNKTNLEFLAGIPGTVGGATYMNAGALGSEISDYFLYCDCLTDKGGIKRLTHEDMAFEYRRSILHERNYIVLDVTMRINSTRENMMERIKEYRKRRIETQPLNYPNCGSVFKNGTRKAWELITASGLRGRGIGEVIFSPKHANFMINLGDAKSIDAYRLVKYAERKVFEKTGEKLEKEIMFLNF